MLCGNEYYMHIHQNHKSFEHKKWFKSPGTNYIGNQKYQKQHKRKCDMKHGSSEKTMNKPIHFFFFLVIHF